jgi:hypothetical protein
MNMQNGRTALYKAASHDVFKTMELLLNRGANIDATNKVSSYEHMPDQHQVLFVQYVILVLLIGMMQYLQTASCKLRIVVMHNCWKAFECADISCPQLPLK